MSIRTPLLLVALLAGCGASGNSRAPAPPTQEESAEAARLAAEARLLFEQRAEREPLERAVATFEQALEMDPTDTASCETLARATQFLGEAHMADAPADERVPLFEKGMGWADRCLRAINERYAQLRGSGVEIEEAVEALETTDAPLVYRYANNLGSLANARGRVAGMKYKDRIAGLMTWVLERMPGYDFGGAHRFFGAYYAAIPAFIGGDLDESRGHFESAIEAAPRYPGNYLLMAEFYATAAGDRALFEELLGKVRRIDACTEGGPRPCIPEGYAPEAAHDRKRAEELAGEAGSLF